MPRRPVGIEIVYDVLEDGHILTPSYQFDNEAGTCVFCTIDLEPGWRGRTRPCGRFTSVAWIPGNFLAEGAVLVTPAISAHRPIFNVHMQHRDAVAFHVRDTFEGDSARGDWDGSFSGVVRPLLTWSTEFIPVDTPADEQLGPGSLRS